MKKSTSYTFAIASLLVSGIQATDQPCMSNGFYIGAHAGTIHHKNNLKIFYENSDTSPLALQEYGESKKRVSKFLVAGGIHAGYEHVTGEWFAAFEIDGRVSTNVGKKVIIPELTEDDIDLKLIQRFSIIPKLNLGRIVNNCFYPYLSMGLSFTKYRARIGAAEYGTSSSHKFTLIQFTPGFGVKYMLNQRVSFRFEGHYALKAKKIVTAVGEGDEDYVAGARNSISAVTAMAGISYKI